ncbi:hypothetical protein Q4555_09310 [Octadecabacter sp. 1_MG-2023]|uniref:hypothetical protein n=1 Tax=unclassified Octadecabacter TaxID=196158 RepID=UPI001C0A20CE|nr:MULTISPECIES: hypothetical protein [unclassified Octadecabacter]MBU2992374.1 hypothetical protein [Octadecabacter sp. B2R22]MDO6734869.1 hypothetical protein [Octadecabacter sp. 1_MG-2023]
MAFIADILLTAGALAAGFYCFILSRRLRRFTDLEQGVGGAIAVLSVQVDDLSKALKQAEYASSTSGTTLVAQCEQADHAAKRLELLMASLHDLPDPNHSIPKQPQTPTIDPFFVRSPIFSEEAT